MHSNCREKKKEKQGNPDLDMVSTPVILGTWEGEVERSQFVEVSPGKSV
jgi:hypothetical protein